MATTQPGGPDGTGGPGEPVGARHQDGTSGGGSAAPEGAVRLTAWARGTVQGVGFRWWVRARALELGLVGTATNLADGRVEVVAEGGRPRCEELLALLAAGGAPGRVAGVTHRWSSARGGHQGFTER